MKIKNKKAIIFDFWGTLAYNPNHRLFKKLKNFVSKHMGKSYWKKLFKYNITENQFYHDLKQFSSPLVAWHAKKLIEKQKQSFKLYKDTIPCLEYLRKQYKLGIISNTFFITDYVINTSNIKKYFDTIILSYKVNITKPNKKIFELGVKRLNIKAKETLFIGDSYIEDYLGAKKAGLKSILLDRNNKHKKIKEKIRNLKQLI